MAVIVGTKTPQNKARLEIIHAAAPSGIYRIGDASFNLSDLQTSIKGFNQFWELMDVVKRHGYLSAAMRTIGRSFVSSGWSLRKHPEYGKIATDIQRIKLLDFYTYRDRQWDNIKDYQSFTYKMMLAAMYLRYFGQAAFYIFRNADDDALGFDFLHGYVYPNVDDAGYFKSPAFYQFPSRNPTDRIDFESQNDIVYMINPDWEGVPSGGSDMEALTTFTLPLDIYLMTAARDYMRNRDKPEVVYSLPADISPEGFDAFVKQMQANHSGASNLGRNPIAVQGDFSVHELRDLPERLPYQESRLEARNEELAVAGVSSAKLGIADNLSSANLREIRREFHETSLQPLLNLVELYLYEQVHVREFNIPGWEFKFASPDFLTAVERATVHMRYVQMGVMNPNEVRFSVGLPPRTDEYADDYVNLAGTENPDEYPGNGGTRGSPPEGRLPEPDAPSVVGEPRIDEDPVRGDGHDYDSRMYDLNLFKSDMRAWRRFAINRITKGKPLRKFRSEYIPQDIVDFIDARLMLAKSVDEIASVFNLVLMEAVDAVQ